MPPPMPPTRAQEFMLEAQYLRAMAQRQRQVQRSNDHAYGFASITQNPELFEEAARKKEAYASAPNSSPRGAMTPGIMNMMMKFIGDPGAVDARMGGGFTNQMKQYISATPSFSMSPGANGFSDNERMASGLYEGGPKQHQQQQQQQPELEMDEGKIARALGSQSNSDRLGGSNGDIGQRLHDLGPQYQQMAMKYGYNPDAQQQPALGSNYGQAGQGLGAPDYSGDYGQAGRGLGGMRMPPIAPTGKPPKQEKFARRRKPLMPGSGLAGGFNSYTA